jgi:hypothetical protein
LDKNWQLMCGLISSDLNIRQTLSAYRQVPQGDKIGENDPNSDFRLLNAMKFLAASVCTLLAAMSSCQRGLAQTPDKWQDWQVTIAAHSFSPYLDHPGSPVSKLIKATVSYAQPNSGQAKPYEDLYYTSSQVIGCRRNGVLGITPGTAGTILVTSTTSDQSYAVANAVGRLFLDLYMHKCPTKIVVVPQACFGSIISALCNQGFRVAPPVPARQSQGTSALFILPVVSEPSGESVDIMM